MNGLQWLQEWLLENCNIDSDHYYGILIETIDNPGWHIKIQLQDTILVNTVFKKLNIQRENENDWLYCETKNNAFEANCGPKNLEEVILIFRDWVTSIKV